MMTEEAYREFMNLSEELNQAIRPRTQFRYGKTLDTLAEMQELLAEPESWQAWHERQKGGRCEKN
jgi:hypothetical protein